MIFGTFIASVTRRWEKRKLYRRLVAEIESLTDREIAELGGDRGDMLRATYDRVYGAR
jgi:hypothetical protein